ncbi:MAG: hypothetical protein BWY29_00385 [Microgenomates group bacterium ADurb.Bin238]|nr:MAG: hypothetical protein BWY29_00385 [Microgenomates group bacterium ADurb.Bin238]
MLQRNPFTSISLAVTQTATTTVNLVNTKKNIKNTTPVFQPPPHSTPIKYT